MTINCKQYDLSTHHTDTIEESQVKIWKYACGIAIPHATRSATSNVRYSAKASRNWSSCSLDKLV